MRTVENPKELFSKINATDIDGDSYEFNIGEDGGGQLAVRKVEVEFEDLSDPADDFHASYEALEENATEIDDADDHDADVDAQFVTEEDGRRVIYMADTDRMGYEIIRQEDEPRLAAYAVIFPDALVKVVPAQ